MRDRLTRRPGRRHGGPPPARRREPARDAPAEEQPVEDERRARESGRPEDRAQYTCSCGYVWEADVSTSVRCPNCGAVQAW
jgi:rubrerythrin